MSPRRTGVIALREVRTVVRGRFFVLSALVFAILAGAVSHLGMAGAGRWGVSTLDRTSVALLNLVLLFVPLAALPLGVASFAGEAEDGVMAYLVAQPVSRAEVFLGKVVGLTLAMTLSLALGFGVAAVLVGAGGGVASGSFAMVGVGAWLLGCVMVALGVALSTLSSSRAVALAAVIGAWITLVFLCDFGVLALAAARLVSPQALFVLVVANPLQAVKTLVALYASARLEILGPVGVEAVRAFGRGGLALALVGSLALWLGLASGAAYALFRRDNLT